MIHRIFFLLICCLLCNIGHSQSIQYDSLSNISKTNYMNLRGEVLVYPKSKYIWPNLFWSNTKGKIYHRFRYFDGQYYSKNEFVQNKSYLIEDIVFSKNNEILLKTKCLENNDKVYINCYFLENSFPPFYILGFLEKSRKNYLNSNFLIYKSYLEDNKEFGFYNDTEDNGMIVKVKCTDVYYMTSKNGVGIYLNIYGEKSDKNFGLLVRDLSKAVIPDTMANKIRNDYQNRLYKTEVAKKFMGKRVYYGFKQKYKLNTEDERYNSARLNKTLYDNVPYIINEGYYNCVDFKFLEGNIAFAILKDNDGILFRVPVYKEQVAFGNVWYEGYNAFSDYFILEEEALSIIAEKAKKEQERIILYNKLLNKYGKKYAEEFSDYPPKAERFEQLAKKYGKEDAKLMLTYGLKIGWNYEKVRISWGKPDRVHTTTNKYGTREQWIYESNFDSGNSYLYFENGKLTAIQD